MQKRDSKVGEIKSDTKKKTETPKLQSQKLQNSNLKGGKNVKKPNVIFQIINAKFNQNIEEGGKDMDPYIKIKYEEGEIKTQVALNAGKTPTWNFKESVYIENLEQDLLIEVWEWDKNTTDDYLAAAKINLQSAFNHNGKTFALEVIRKGQGKDFSLIVLAFGFINMQVVESQEDLKFLYENPNVFQDFYNSIEKSFEVIFSEILNYNIPQSKLFAYSALRLRQIGRDLENIKEKKYNSQINQQNEEERKKILDEMEEDDDEDEAKDGKKAKKLNKKKDQLDGEGKNQDESKKEDLKAEKKKKKKEEKSEDEKSAKKKDESKGGEKKIDDLEKKKEEGKDPTKEKKKDGDEKKKEEGKDPAKEKKKDGDEKKKEDSKDGKKKEDGQGEDKKKDDSKDPGKEKKKVEEKKDEKGNEKTKMK